MDVDPSVAASVLASPSKTNTSPASIFPEACLQI
jgi:hypothetical protein